MRSKNPSARSAERYFDPQAGLLSRQIFYDPEIYREELSKVFAKTWLYLGHESQVPGLGDFMTNYMGEDPVIIVRDTKKKVRVYLNTCRHRGMRVCRADVGKTRSFVCPFHGWTYSLDGKLAGVPMLEDAYKNALDRDKFGLLEVPKVEIYGGLIFANMDPEAESLDSYLGEMRWYLDIFLSRPVGTLEFYKGRQRYSCKSNWKIAGENFAGDAYHLPFSHASLFQVDARWVNPVTYTRAKELYSITFENGHGLNGISAHGERYDADMELAREMGPEVVDYVEQTQRCLQERLNKLQTKIYTLAFGHIFPHFSFNNFSALRPYGFYLWQPRGPSEIEVWQWCAVDSEAPQAVKDIALVDFTRNQASSGIAGQDDSENFEQVTEASRGIVAQTLDFNYQMGLGEGELATKPKGMPGRVGPYYSEQGQRNFYGYWAELMGLDAMEGVDNVPA